MAYAAEGFPACLHSPGLFLPLAQRWNVGADELCAGAGGAEKGGACIDPSGYDAGKKIKGKKRHILVDTVGLLLHALVHPADIQTVMAACWS